MAYAQLVYRLENGRMNPDNVKAHQLEALLSVLQWTHADWNTLHGRTIDLRAEVPGSRVPRLDDVARVTPSPPTSS